MSKQQLGFIGVGHMGGGMAQRLLAQGYPLLVFDTSAQAMQRFKSLGAELATSSRDVADRMEIVFACLPSEAACRAVALGPDGVAKGKKIKIYIEASTIGAAAVNDIAAALAEHKIETIDAPVSGGARGAVAGTLTSIVSGEPQAVDRVRDVLADLSKNVFVVGDKPGLAQSCKLVNNALSMSAMLMTSEAMVAGVKAGLDATTLIDMINASTGRNSATQVRFPKTVLPRTFDFGGHLSNGMKDISLYVDMCRKIGMPTPLGSQLATLWQVAIARYGSEPDSSNIVRIFEEWAGVEVRGRDVAAPPEKAP